MAEPDRLVSGFEKKVYYKTGAWSAANGDWDRIENTTADINQSDEIDMIEFKNRDKTVTTYSPTYRTTGLTFTIQRNPSNTGYLALLDAYETKAIINIATTDQALATGVKFFGGGFFIKTFPHNNGESDPSTVEIEVVPAEGGQAVDFYTAT